MPPSTEKKNYQAKITQMHIAFSLQVIYNQYMFHWQGSRQHRRLKLCTQQISSADLCLQFLLPYCLNLIIGGDGSIHMYIPRGR